MKLDKNEFVLIYESLNEEEYVLGLVEIDSTELEEEVKVIIFSKKNNSLLFEPFEEQTIQKTRIMKIQSSMVMHSSENEEVVEVSYELDESIFENALKDSLEEYKEKNGLNKSILSIKGKKNTQDILKSIKNNDELSQKVKKISRRKPKLPKFKKGKINPLITSVVDGSLQFQGSFPKMVDDCCFSCNNKELLRAINTNNRMLFDYILKTKSKITSVLCKSSVNSNQNSVTLSLEKGNNYFFEKLMSFMYKKDDKNYNNFINEFYAQTEPSRINRISTGHNDKYAYGVKTKNVAMARGNREGNNALIKDNHQFFLFGNDKSHLSLFANLERTAFIHELVFLNFSLQNWMRNNLVSIIQYGNVDIAALILKIIIKNGGYGFSQYHLLALSMNVDPSIYLEDFKKKKAEEKEKNKENPKPKPIFNAVDVKENAIEFGEEFLTKEEQLELLAKMRKTNVVKKASFNSAITPLHCACINPNSFVLEHFINVGEDLFTYDLELRKPVHYAACSKTPNNLRLLLKKGVDLRDTDKIKKTPIMYACEFGRLENVKLIVENCEINIDAKCRNARGPIHFAVENGHFGKILLKSNNLIV